jgi:membrane protein implicated in regulation of membrane protease activity
MMKTPFAQTAVGIVILAIVSGLAVTALQRLMDGRASEKQEAMRPSHNEVHSTQTTYGDKSPIVSGGNVVITGK